MDDALATDTQDWSIDPVQFRTVLGCHPTGVCAITAMPPSGQPAAMIVGTFTSVSLSPPLVGFLPDRKSASWAQIETAQAFCANILASDQRDICARLAAKGTDKFAEVPYTLSAHGLPLIGGAIAHIECTLHSVTDAGDHLFVLGRVRAMQIASEASAMLFFRGGYGAYAPLS